MENKRNHESDSDQSDSESSDTDYVPDEYDCESEVEESEDEQLFTDNESTGSEDSDLGDLDDSRYQVGDDKINYPWFDMRDEDFEEAVQFDGNMGGVDMANQRMNLYNRDRKKVKLFSDSLNDILYL